MVSVLYGFQSLSVPAYRGKIVYNDGKMSGKSLVRLESYLFPTFLFDSAKSKRTFPDM